MYFMPSSAALTCVNVPVRRTLSVPLPVAVAPPPEATTRVP
ncbi:MAG: hypothetical protein AVDCRST_MAG85-3414 [uncultured Solirubrobacteraceae bacterium]|uniref:Uncharacterized protein n=1 Tax=uncultured Solirubrobacteraceae bacterium TaxID=1162706 RepID=A0A6J4TNJ9_9ACTN|nr:MAG: hypothetical protein AVDCRST_MAG85-3414 [uncultured Solirubrobacteraceae bacterium]